MVRDSGGTHVHMKKSKLLALLGAAALTFGVVGLALAVPTGDSDQGVTPTSVDNNIKLYAEGGNDQADCTNLGTEEEPEWDGIETGDEAGSDTSPGGVTVTWTYNSETKEFGFTATGGVVTIAYVKGGNSGYNVYDYVGDLGHGVTSDGGMFAPNTGADLDQPAGLSHAVFCTGEGEDETAPPETIAPTFTDEGAGDTDIPTQTTTDTLGTDATSGPADGAWLLVVALGVLLASIVVLTPARAKSRR